MLQERDDIVAIDSAILQHPRVWEASGHLAGFTDPLVDCRTCGQRFRADHLRSCRAGANPRSTPARPTSATLTRGARLQPDVRDDDRPGQGVGRDRLPAPGDRAGDLHQLQERAAVLAQETAVRHRPGGQVLPQRDHPRATSSSARASSSRWRWSSSCRPPRRQQLVRALAGGARALVRRARASARTTCACARTTATSSPTTPRRRATSNTSSRRLREGRAGRSSRGSPTAATSISRATRSSRARSSSTSTRPAASATCPHVIEPAAGADRAHARLPRGRLRRGIRRARGHRRGRARTVLRLHPRLAPVKAAVLPLVGKDGQPELAREVHRALRDARALRVRRRRRDRPALPPPGRDRHPLLPYDRPPEPRGPDADAARPRLAGAGAAADRGHRRGDRAARAARLGRHQSRAEEGARWTST